MASRDGRHLYVTTGDGHTVPVIERVASFARRAARE